MLVSLLCACGGAASLGVNSTGAAAVVVSGHHEHIAAQIEKKQQRSRPTMFELFPGGWVRIERPEPRHVTPTTIVGGVLLPVLALLWLASLVGSTFASAQTKARIASNLWTRFGGSRTERVLRLARSPSQSPSFLQSCTRVLVSLYFLHEGVQAIQVKYAQYEQVNAHDSGPATSRHPWLSEPD